MKNLQKDICGPVNGLQRFKQRPDLIMCGLNICRACHKQQGKRKKHQWAIEKKPKLDNARKLRGIDFINPEGGEFKETLYKRKEVGDTNGGGYAL